jgi:hypothetical protein
MKFKELTQDQIDYARSIYANKEMSWDERMLTLVRFFGKSERTVRKWCSERLGFKERVDVEPEQYVRAKERTYDREKKRFIITWAQNDTLVHKKLLTNIEAYAEYLNADIHVIAGRYKNPTSLSASEKVKATESWSPEIVKYLDAAKHDIHKYLSIMSDVKIQPTAVNPMSGLEGISGVNSCVFGSPKIQMQTIPVLHGQKPKMMVTTGAITKKDYTDSKAGKKGEFHHTYGFVIVEIKNDETFFMRQVTAKESGAFTDLCYKVEDGAVTTINSMAAIILGDYHAGDHDSKVIAKTLEFMKKVVPQQVVIHDLFNGHSINHHEDKNPFLKFDKEISNKNSLKDEIDEMLSELKKFENYNVVIVRSNHDDFIDRWLESNDWRKMDTLKNSYEYMIFSAAKLKGEAKDGIVPWLIKTNYPKFKALNRSDTFRVKNWELANHGDIGSNGTRGSLEQYRRLNTKMIIGHSHSPGRKDGVLQVGTSTHLRVGYNQGPSGWAQSHVFIHNDGKAQHVTFTDGEFTTFIF